MYMKTRRSSTVSDMYGTKFKEKNKHEDNHICIYYRSACCQLPMVASLIATNAKFNKGGASKNGYGYFVGIGTIVTIAIIVAALIFAAKTFF